jgi:CRISPR-associated protein Csx14
MSDQRQAALVATLGTQPEVVTIALDLLLNLEVDIRQVHVIHTVSSPPRLGTPLRPKDLAGLRAMAESVRTLRQEFPGGTTYLYRGEKHHPCRFYLTQLEVDGRPIDDVRTEAEARAVFAILFQVVQELKKDRFVVHLSIAGGRKSMSVYGMAAAQLLFDSQDRLWHVFSSPEFEGLSLMHPRGTEDARLVSIPVLPISSVVPGMVTLLTSRDPLSVLESKQALMAMEERRNREEFLIGCLTPAEKGLVDLFMDTLLTENKSLSNSELARKLLIRPGVVRNRFSSIYAKLCQYLGLPEGEQVDRPILAAFLTPYYRQPL